LFAINNVAARDVGFAAGQELVEFSELKIAGAFLKCQRLETVFNDILGRGVFTPPEFVLNEFLHSGAE